MCNAQAQIMKMLSYVFFWGVLWRMKFSCQHFRTLCSMFIGVCVQSVTAIEKLVVQDQVWERIVSWEG
jgi:hypothetical protein